LIYNTDRKKKKKELGHLKSKEFYVRLIRNEGVFFSDFLRKLIWIILPEQNQTKGRSSNKNKKV